MVKNIFKHRELYIMLIPAFLSFIIFAYIPMGGLILAFKDYKFNKGILGSDWIGFEYFVTFFTSYDFGRLLKNTLVIGFIKTILEFPFPIILALMLNELKFLKLKNVVQTVSYLPHFLSTVIIVTMIQRILAPNTGVLNQAIAAFGGDGKTFFLMDPQYFYTILFSMDLWTGIGWGSIIYLAAISGVDPALYESAELDGCGRLKKMWHITLPSIRGTIGILFILSVGGLISSGFAQVYLLRTPGNMSLADTLDVYIVRVGLTGGQYGYATAVGLVQGVVGFLLVLFSNKISKKLTEISIW